MTCLKRALSNNTTTHLFFSLVNTFKRWIQTLVHIPTNTDPDPATYLTTGTSGYDTDFEKLFTCSVRRLHDNCVVCLCVCVCVASYNVFIAFFPKFESVLDSEPLVHIPTNTDSDPATYLTTSGYDMIVCLCVCV